MAGYKLGDWLATCDACGRKVPATSLHKRWDGFMVCREDYETRHPQEFVRGSVDTQVPPWTRPEPEDFFIEGTTELVSFTAANITESLFTLNPPLVSATYTYPASIYPTYTFTYSFVIRDSGDNVVYSDTTTTDAGTFSTTGLSAGTYTWTLTATRSDGLSTVTTGTFTVDAIVLGPVQIQEITLETGAGYHLACTSDGRFLYTTGLTGDYIRGYIRNTSTGMLTEMADSPWNIPFSLGGAMDITPNNRVLAVAGHTTAAVATYLIDSITGALTPASSQSHTHTTSYSMVICQGVAWTVGNGYILGYDINETTGALVYQADYKVALTKCSRLCRSDDRQYIYCNTYQFIGGDVVSGYRIDSGGDAVFIGATAQYGAGEYTSGGSYVMAIARDGLSFFFTLNLTGISILQYSRNPSTGVLTYVDEEVATAGGTNFTQTTTIDGAYLLSLVYASNAIRMYTNSSGTIAPYGSPVSIGTTPNHGLVTPDNATVYIAGSTPPRLLVFTLF